MIEKVNNKIERQILGKFLNEFTLFIFLIIKKLKIEKIMENKDCCKVSQEIVRLNVGSEIIENEIKKESFFEISFSIKNKKKI